MKTKTSTWKHEEVPDLLVMRADAVWMSCEQQTLICPQQFIRHVPPPAALQAPPLLLYRLRPSPGCSHMFLLL